MRTYNFVSSKGKRDESCFEVIRAISKLKKTLKPGSVISIKELNTTDPRQKKPIINQYRVLKLYPHHIWCSDMNNRFHRSILYYDALCGGVTNE